MTANASTLKWEEGVPPNVPIASVKKLIWLQKLDHFLLRWFNYSYMARVMAKATNMAPVSAFILITKGRKSGRWIEVPIYYFRDGANYVVIGSKGGMQTHPVWFLNMQADPNCKIYTRWRTHNVRARVAQGEERARIWAHAAQLFPNYNDYQKTATSREIPVVVLEPR